MRALTLAAGLFLAGVLAAGAPAAATPLPPATPADFCVVRVVDAHRWSGSGEEHFFFAVRSFPRSPLVLVSALLRDGTWEITEDRRYARAAEVNPPRPNGEFFGTIRGDFVEETHSGRTLAVGRGGLLQLLPGAPRFVPLWPGQWSHVEPGSNEDLRYVAAWQATAIRGRQGLFLLRDATSLEPVLGPGGERLHDVQSIAPVPGRGALLVQMRNGSVALVTGETGPDRARWLYRVPPWWMPGFLAETPSGRPGRPGDPSEVLGAVLPQPAPDTFLIRGPSRGHLLTLPRDGGEPTVTLVERQAERAWERYRRLAPGSRDYLVHVKSTWDLNWVTRAGLYRLDGEDFVAVPGASGRRFGHAVYLVDVPSRGMVAIIPNSGPLTVYRDRVAQPVPDSDAILGTGSRRVRDLPGIGRVVLRSPRGFHELTRDLRLLPLEVSGPMPEQAAAIEDMPASGVGVVLGGNGIHIIGAEGGLVHLPQTTGLDTRSLGRTYYLPNRRELLFTTPRDGIYLLVDRRLSGAEAGAAYR